MRKMGVLQVGESPSDTEAADGVEAAQLMIDSFNSEKLMLHYVRRDEFALSDGVGTYTVGSGATWNIDRPVHISGMGFLDVTSQNEYQLDSPMSDLEFREWALRGLQSSRFTHWYWQPTYPNAKVWLFPIPISTANSKAVLYSWAPLTTFSSDIPTALNTVLALPPGYQEMLVYQLAERMAPDFGVAVSDSVARKAMELKARVKRANYTVNQLRLEPALLVDGGGYYDITAGGYI